MQPINVSLAPADRELNRIATTRSRALLLINQQARSGKTDITPALARLRNAGIELLSEQVERPTQVTDILTRYRGHADLVIIGGGDGSLSMAADGLVEAQLPLGIIPLGTANDLARTLNLPLDPLAAAEVIVAGHQRRIDLGRVNGKHFFNVATIGLGVGVTRRLTRERKRRWGVLAYLFAGLEVLTHVRPFAVDITTPADKVRVRTVQVMIGNGRHFGGGMTVHEAAFIDDGLLNLVSLEVEHWWQLVKVLPAMWRGREQKAHVRSMQGPEFTVTPVKKRHRKVTADGEVATRTPAHFRVVPGALAVFVPEAPPETP
jgi:diacylglycerol kinase (ATP)